MSNFYFGALSLNKALEPLLGLVLSLRVSPAGSYFCSLVSCALV